jgi:hypothetical protein
MGVSSSEGASPQWSSSLPLLLSTSPAFSSSSSSSSSPPPPTLPSQLRTDCAIEHRESLECISRHYEEKNEKCAPFFERYKACRKAEHESKLQHRHQQREANAVSDINSNKSSGSWFW